jgi:hypothetical protein
LAIRCLLMFFGVFWILMILIDILKI